MSTDRTRTTINVAASVLQRVDQLVELGRAKSRNEVVEEALRRELERLERQAIDAAFAGMGDDPDYLADVTTLDREFASADIESLTSIAP